MDPSEYERQDAEIHLGDDDYRLVSRNDNVNGNDDGIEDFMLLHDHDSRSYEFNQGRLDVTNMDNDRLFQQFFYPDEVWDSEWENFIRGRLFEAVGAAGGNPPASKKAVEALESVVVSGEDVEAGNNVVCAVCKVDMVVGDEARELPCRHRYHGDCILPWLEIRNTCPVCRFELKTDESG